MSSSHESLHGCVIVHQYPAHLKAFLRSKGGIYLPAMSKHYWLNSQFQTLWSVLITVSVRPSDYQKPCSWNVLVQTFITSWLSNVGLKISLWSNYWTKWHVLVYHCWGIILRWPVLNLPFQMHNLSTTAKTSKNRDKTRGRAVGHIVVSWAP